MAEGNDPECIVCFKSVPSDGIYMKCASCHNAYHLDACSGISERTFKSMGNAKRENWNCRTCRNRESRLSVSTLGEPVTPDQQGSVSALLIEIDKKLELLHSLKVNVDRLCDLPAKVDDLLSLKPSVDAMKETIKGLQESVKKCESVMQLVVANERDIKLLRTEVGTLQATVSEQTSMIEHLQNNVNSTEQYSRRCNMEIHGVPCTRDEDLKITLDDLATKLSIQGFNPAEVTACHRLRSRREGAPPILVQFGSVSAKEKWMSARKKLATLPRTGRQERIYFNDNLTRTNKDIFWQARTKGREKSYKFVWVKNGTIFAKKDETSIALRIASTRDIEKIT